MSAGAATTASPFAVLLRRSRFASYDPYIRQTYTAPPDHASRGSWGLKRALPLRRRDAFITVPNAFDSPNYFVDWSNAENQVRFIKRFEEMDTFPTLYPTAPWAANIDTKNATNWLIDSEFTEWDEGPEIEEVGLSGTEEEIDIESEAVPTETVDTQAAEELRGDSSFRFDLPTLGKSGKGAYGAHRPVTPIGNTASVSRNIYAMSNKEFERYLKKLRKFRPEFKKYMAHAAEKDNPDGTPHHLRGVSLYELAQNAGNSRHHHLFLASHTSAELRTPESRLIEPRPHPNGGLMYARLPELYSHFYSRKEDGIVLQTRKDELQSKKEKKESRPTYEQHDPDRQFIVSFGGMTSVIEEETELTSKNRSPRTVSLFSYNEVPESSTAAPSPFTRPSAEGVGIGASIIPMRLQSAQLVSPPIVVGHRKQGLKAVRLATTVTTNSHAELQRTSNPHKPGTWKYMAMGPPKKQAYYMASSPPASEFQSSLLRAKAKDETAQIDTQQNSDLILALRNMV